MWVTMSKLVLLIPAPKTTHDFEPNFLQELWLVDSSGNLSFCPSQALISVLVL